MQDLLTIGARRTGRDFSSARANTAISRRRAPPWKPRRGDRDRGDPAHQHRPEPQRAEPARGTAPFPVHVPAEYRRLLHGGGCGAHAAACPRAARRA